MKTFVLTLLGLLAIPVLLVAGLIGLVRSAALILTGHRLPEREVSTPTTAEVREYWEEHWEREIAKYR